jgi:hypothetical protein
MMQTYTTQRAAGSVISIPFRALTVYAFSPLFGCGKKEPFGPLGKNGELMGTISIISTDPGYNLNSTTLPPLRVENAPTQ